MGLAQVASEAWWSPLTQTSLETEESCRDNVLLFVWERNASGWCAGGVGEVISYTKQRKEMFQAKDVSKLKCKGVFLLSLSQVQQER